MQGLKVFYQNYILKMKIVLILRGKNQSLP